MLLSHTININPSNPSIHIQILQTGLHRAYGKARIWNPEPEPETEPELKLRPGLIGKH